MRAVVHIGFHKTGTTTLQYELFPQLPGVVLLTRAPHHGPPGYGEFARGLCKLGDADYDEAGLRRFLEDVAPTEPGTLLLSDEGLSGIPYLGTVQRDQSRRRLASLFPDARIIIGIRAQASMWRSLHSEYVSEGGTRSFAAFVENRALGYEFDREYVRYDTIIEQYQRTFGIDRVKVLPFELLTTDVEAYVKEVAAFVLAGSGLEMPPIVDLDVANRSISRWSRNVVQTSNRLFRPSRFNPRPLLLRSRIEHQIRRGLRRLDPMVFPNPRRPLGASDQRALDALLPHYEESNAAVEHLTGLDLRGYGYPLPAAAAE